MLSELLRRPSAATRRAAPLIEVVGSSAADGDEEMGRCLGSTRDEEDGSEDSKMWGNFYIGLYLEALGKHEAARTHFVNAAESGSHNNIARNSTASTAARVWEELRRAHEDRRDAER